MPPLVIPDTVRVNIVWANSGVDYAVNVLHYIVPGAQVVTAATATDLATDIATPFVSGALDTWIADQISIARITVRDIRTANQPEYSSTVSAAGLSSTDMLPPGTSLVATFRTALAGRSYRGRFYMPGWAETANTAAGTADAGAVGDLETWLQAISSVTVEGNAWALGVMSTVLGETNPVTAIEVRDSVWDSQRRRAVPGI